MKHVDEFRQRDRADGLTRRIREVSRKSVSIMEICGTHTHALSRYGIREALPAGIRLVSGPGCPVCVTSEYDIDRLIEFCGGNRDVIIATFGDMMRVPGSRSTLEEERAAGADVRVLYSPLGALDIAASNPDREVVLYAVGFETTAPTVAAAILAARERRMGNLSVLALHKLTPPAMKALLDAGGVEIDGFLCPGHVTAVIGAKAYGFLSDVYHKPCVVAGFEPLDALMGIYMLIEQLERGRSEIEVEYSRVVSRDGNLKAQAIASEVFEPADALWRGIGLIPASGLRIRERYGSFDAERRFRMDGVPARDGRAGCGCGDVLRGAISPPECALFAVACTPDDPAGPCMVSSEGTCAAFYRYRGAGA
jgi:hydrogenase expression/formation protein HypD